MMLRSGGRGHAAAILHCSHISVYLVMTIVISQLYLMALNVTGEFKQRKKKSLNLPTDYHAYLCSNRIICSYILQLVMQARARLSSDAHGGDPMNKSTEKIALFVIYKQI